MGSRLGRMVVALGAAVVLTTSCSSDGESSDSAGAASAPASSSAAEESRGAYLALGDSVPFGFRGGATAEFSDADNFVGYPELVGEELSLEVLNAACPGETTESFLDATAQSNGCQNTLQSDVGYRKAYPVHVQYDSFDQSQLDFAVDTLTENDDVELVTLQIGANDVFLCQQTTPSRCSDPANLQALAQSVQANVETILSTLRDEAGYDGQVVVVTYYALNYSDAFGAATGALVGGIAQIAAASGADVADGYEAFRAQAGEVGGDSTAAGLVLPNDVHPTEEGQRLLAEAVLAVVED
ncbi:GDSL-like lipase/acylhydrolase family protein [Blastococcus colisei]|uniref:GDSL-like lipase/acylhydrolase family protein n=1 Tax=Blastococcus colisei TaxID=1564162 RepID=A0A543PD75_9ACTN|nr:SGNH/GDSL hydrolase family protein [Blastococcus colisei]TQN42042.1 GDSL-like lipase/acylhydrolase family protein [Blastococcus colisei]